MTDLLAQARDLLSRVPLVDGHNDLPWALREAAGYDLDRLDVAREQPQLMTDIPRLRSGRLGAQFWSVFVPATLQRDRAVSATLEQIDAVYALAARYPDTLEIALTAADVTRIFAAGRIASLIGMEGGHSIDCSLGTLRTMYALGARYMTLTHNDNLPWADSATDVAACGGLTAFGVEVVREMNRLGMLVDLSHVAPSTMRAALDATGAPVIFSHSSARALCDVPRNIPDDVLTRLPDNGGVAMVTFVPYFVSPAAAVWAREKDAQAARLRDRYGTEAAQVSAQLAVWVAANPMPPVTAAEVADHVDHVREVAGIDHVGIGGDMDGVDAMPVDLPDVSAYPVLFAELARRRWAEQELTKLAGANVLRVLAAAEREAAAQRGRAPSLARIDDSPPPGVERAPQPSAV